MALRHTVMVCIAHALVMYAEVTGQSLLLERARRIYKFLQGFFDKSREKSSVSSLLARVYFLRLAIALGEDVSKEDIEIFLRERDLFRDSPIYWLQTLSLLVDYAKQGEKSNLDFLMQETQKVYRVFGEKRDRLHTQLASYPEIISVLHGLFQITRDSKWQEYAEEVVEWYISYQREDGAFPHSPKRDFVYTRGTSKIFEVLTFFSKENNKTLQRVFHWIESMQYTKENLFWVEEKKEQYLIGGFRHDAFNREAWVDAAAHVILATARLLEGDRDIV